MSNPVASSGGKVDTSAAKNKMKEMANMANQLKAMSGISNMLNLGGGIMGKLGGVQAGSILNMIGPDAIFPKIQGALAGAQAMMQIMANISKMTQKAESIGNAKAGIPDSNTAKQQAQEKMNAAKAKSVKPSEKSSVPPFTVGGGFAGGIK